MCFSDVCLAYRWQFRLRRFYTPPTGKATTVMKFLGEFKELINRGNVMDLAVAVAVIAIGFMLMSGGGSQDPTGFNPEIFSSRRIVVAPAVTVIGFVLMIFGILKNSKNKEVAE